MAADGSGSLLFDLIERATSWLAAGEGLMSLQRGGLGIDISVHRKAGILATEMAHLPDDPFFDVVTLTIPEKTLLDSTRESAWASLQEASLAALLALPFSFAYGLSEAAEESVAEFDCVHRRVAFRRLPPFLPWLCGVPGRSGLSRQVSEAALVVGRPVGERHGICVLTLTDAPWDRADQAVIVASSRWREATNDNGCS
jgi:hypothetical protein